LTLQEDNQKKKNNYRKNYRKRQNRIIETNSNNENKTNEFNSYSSKSTSSYSEYWFGFNIFEAYSQEQLEALVKDPMTYNKILREISLILYGMNGTFTHAVDYMTAMPTLYRTIITHGKNADRKRKNKELLESTLRLIRDKEFVRDALFKGMVEGIAFYYFETTGKQASLEKYLNDYDVNSIVEINDLGLNASIISLPTDYTEIIGKKNNSYVIAFNLDYFDIADGEPTERKLRKFPKEIREAYSKKKDGNTKGNWVVLDNNKTIVHKVRSKSDEKYGRPLVLAAISDILYRDYFTKTKRGVLDEINNKLIYQTFPEGQNKGTCALTKDQQQNQHNTVKGAVLNKNNRGGTSFVSVAAGTKLNRLEIGDTDIFDEKYESNLSDDIALAIGIAGSLLNGVGSGSYSAQQQNLELISGLLFQWVEQIQTELNKCINATIITDKRNWVEFCYLPTTHVNKKEMVGFAKDLYLQGKGSLSLWAAACGISPEAFFAMLDQELEDNVEEKYPVHKTSFTYSEKDTGRPKTDSPSDNTVRSQSNNGNALPSPSDK
jgi:hypothetical protein